MKKRKSPDRDIQFVVGLGMSDLLSNFTLHRTLRVPDAEGHTYNLPPSLGAFPIVACKDTAAPIAWENDYMFPMYNSEAMWVGFRSHHIPVAIAMTASGVNVLTGDVVTDIDKLTLVADPQNYMVAPPQPWLDGIKHADGKVRQFVAVRFESGKSLGQQIAGIKDDTIKMVFYPSKFPEKYARPRGGILRSMSFNSFDGLESSVMACAAAPESMSMGIGAGGEIDQKVYPDPHGIEEWDMDKPSKITLRVVNALMWKALTGKNPPYEPPTANDYRYHNFPWFDLYEERASDLNPSDVLAALKSVYGGTEQHVITRPPVPLGHPPTIRPMEPITKSATEE